MLIAVCLLILGFVGFTYPSIVVKGIGAISFACGILALIFIKKID